MPTLLLIPSSIGLLLRPRGIWNNKKTRYLTCFLYYSVIWRWSRLSISFEPKWRRRRTVSSARKRKREIIITSALTNFSADGGRWAADAVSRFSLSLSAADDGRQHAIWNSYQVVAIYFFLHKYISFPGSTMKETAQSMKKKTREKIEVFHLNSVWRNDRPYKNNNFKSYRWRI